MKWFRVTLFVGVLIATSLLRAESVATDPNAERIVALSWQAMGGRQAMEAVTHFYREGFVMEAQHRDRIRVWWSAPNRWRIERSREHLGEVTTTVTATDGEIVWQQSLTPEPGRAVALEGVVAEAFHAQFVWRGRLWAEAPDRVIRLRYEREQNLSGKRAFQVATLTAEDRRLGRHFFDAETFLPLGFSFFDALAGQAVDVFRWIRRWRSFDGVALPVEIEDRVEGQTLRQINYRFTELNGEAPAEDLFTNPRIRERWLRQSDD